MDGIQKVRPNGRSLCHVMLMIMV